MGERKDLKTSFCTCNILNQSIMWNIIYHGDHKLIIIQKTKGSRMLALQASFRTKNLGCSAKFLTNGIRHKIHATASTSSPRTKSEQEENWLLYNSHHHLQYKVTRSQNFPTRLIEHLPPSCHLLACLLLVKKS